MVSRNNKEEKEGILSVKKKIFNPHKLKRKWGRKFKKTSQILLSSDDSVKKKDFDWHRRKMNPHWRDKDSSNWKRIIQIAILIISFFTMLGFGIYHPFFHIDDFQVQGLQRINEKEFKNAVCGMIDYRKLLVFPGKSYFLVDVNEVKNIIKDRFPIEKVIVKKVFPNVVTVQLEEKISTIIYDNGKQYSYLGMEGNVVEILRRVGDDEWNIKTEVTTSTNEQGEEIREEKEIERSHRPSVSIIIKEIGDYPIVYDKRGKEAGLNQQVLNKETIVGIISWFNFISKQTEIPFGYIVLENEIGDGVIKTREGWDLRVKINNEVEMQFKRLKHILKEEVKRPNLNYIDLRYQDRVYWQ